MFFQVLCSTRYISYVLYCSIYNFRDSVYLVQSFWRRLRSQCVFSCDDHGSCVRIWCYCLASSGNWNILFSGASMLSLVWHFLNPYFTSAFDSHLFMLINLRFQLSYFLVLVVERTSHLNFRTKMTIIRLINISPQLCKQVNGSLLPASVISVYCAYVCYTGLSCEPRNYVCNGLHNKSAVSTSTLVLGMLTTVLSVLYSAFRAGSSTTFLSPPSSPKSGTQN